MMTLSGKHILIVGAGVAGISAAIHAIRHGARVTLVESKGYIGGRARSFVDTTTNETIDNGQHVLMGCYHTFLDILQTLGTEQFTYWQKALSVDFAIHDTHRIPSITRLDSSTLPGKYGVAMGIVRMNGVSLRSRLRALYFAALLDFGLVRTTDSDHNEMTTYELLKRYHQTDEMIRILWEPLVLATLNASLDKSAASLLVTVIQKALFGKGMSSAIIFPTHGLSDFFTPFADWLANNNSSLRTSTTLEEVCFADTESDEMCGVRVVHKNTNEFLACDKIIFAVTPHALDRIININRLISFTASDIAPAFSPIVSVYLWFDKNFMTTDFMAMVGTATQWVFNRRNLTSSVTTNPEAIPVYPGHLALTVSAAGNLIDRTAESLVKQCIDELRIFFPDMRSATLMHSKVIKEKMATLQLTPTAQQRRPSCVTHNTACAIAGDWTQTYLPATLEGAAQSGKDAVEYLRQQKP